MPSEREADAGRDARPEDRRAVALGQLPPLDERGAEGEVGEDQDEAREDEHHRREAVVGRASGAARG